MEFGVTKYYIEKNLKNNKYKEKLIATINNSVYYSFYPDKIIKQTKKNKELIYTLSFDKIQENLNENEHYQNLTKMDSIVLTDGNKILDSLSFQNFKKWNGAKVFIIEVNYYHRYPKNKKFRPD